MATAEPEIETSEVAAGVRPFAAAAVWTIAAVTALFHGITASFGDGYWFDEVYMLAIGRHHLDWGSADQPPLAPALAALLDALAPGSLVALRVPAVLATAATVVVASLLARELGCDRRAQVLAAGAQATGLWASLAGHWLTPYTLEAVQWSILIWLLVRWVRLRDDRLLPVLGVVAGIAALTKFQVLLLCAVLLIAVAMVGPRELLRRPLLWVGVVVGAVIAAPTVWWQCTHGWPQLRMAPVVAGEAEALYGGRPGIAVQLVVFAGLATAVLMIYGLWRLLRSDELCHYRFLAVTFLVLYVLFVAVQGRPYYLAGLYAPLAAAGALGLQRRRENGDGRWRWSVWPAYLLSTAIAVGTLFVSVSLVRSEVPTQIAERTADVYHRLPNGQRERTVVVGQSYIVAAYLDGFADRYGLPSAYSANRSYGYFPPPPDDRDVVVYVGHSADDLRPYFDRVRTAAAIGDEMSAFVLTGMHRPWHEIWPRLRTLTV